MKLPGFFKSAKSIYFKLVVILMCILFILILADNLEQPWNRTYDLIGVSVIQGKDMTPKQKSAVKGNQSDENHYLITSGFRETLTGSKIKVIGNPDLVGKDFSISDKKLIVYNRQTGYSYFFCNDFFTKQQMFFRLRYNSNKLEKTSVQFIDSYEPPFVEWVNSDETFFLRGDGVIIDRKSNNWIHIKKKIFTHFNKTYPGDLYNPSTYVSIELKPISDSFFIAVFPTLFEKAGPYPNKNALARLSTNSNDDKYTIWGSAILDSSSFTFPLIDVTPDGKATFLSILKDTKIRTSEIWLCVWDSTTGKGEAVIKLEDKDPEKASSYKDIAWNPAGDKIAICHNYKGIFIVDYKNKKTLAVFPIKEVVIMRWNNSGSKLGIITEFNQTNWKLEGKKDGIINTEHKIQNRMYIYTAMTNSIRKVSDNTGFSDFFWAEGK